MKKFSIILAVFATVFVCGCRKSHCFCEAEGYVPPAYLQEVLDRYGRDGCIRVVKQGGYVVDYTGVELYCYEN
jgi:hypothetical protein